MLNIFEDSTRFLDFSLQKAYCDNSVGLYPQWYVTFALTKKTDEKEKQGMLKKLKGNIQTLTFCFKIKLAKF